MLSGLVPIDSKVELVKFEEFLLILCSLLWKKWFRVINMFELAAGCWQLLFVLRGKRQAKASC